MTVSDSGFHSELPSEDKLTSISSSFIISWFLKFFAAIVVFSLVFFIGTGSNGNEQALDLAGDSSKDIAQSVVNQTPAGDNEKIISGLGSFKKDIVVEATTSTTNIAEELETTTTTTTSEPKVETQKSRPVIKALPTNLQIEKVVLYPTESSIKAVAFLKTCPLPSEIITIQLVNEDNTLTTAAQSTCVAELTGTVDNLKADTSYFIQIVHGDDAVFEKEISTCKPGNIC